MIEERMRRHLKVLTMLTVVSAALSGLQNLIGVWK